MTKDPKAPDEGKRAARRKNPRRGKRSGAAERSSETTRRPQAQRSRRGGRSTAEGLDPGTVLAALEDAQRPLRLDALSRALGLRGGERERERLERVLDRLVRDGKVIANRRGAFLLIDRTSLASGTVQGHSDGYGFVVLDEGGDDVFLAPREMRKVFHGDRIAVRITRRDRRGRREGEVARVLERGVTELVGRFHLEHGVSFLVPSDPKQTQNLLIPPDGRRGATDGQIVVATITDPPTPSSQALGRVTEILGEATDPEMEIEIAVRAFGIPHRWPAEVTRASAALGETVRAADKRQREDLRALPFVTIDGADARDFDDAVYAERARRGWRLRVAIADVSHYVAPASPLDTEALHRGTSVYFPRRVVPMLPEALSNGLCSLNPEVDRLVLVCDMRLDENGRVSRSAFAQAIIRSHARLTYEGVQGILDGDPELRARYEPLVPHLEDLLALYRQLARARRRRGAVELDQAEPHFRFDDAGAVIAVEPYQRLETHRIIEECMIAANVEAAHYLQRHRVPALYRVHEGPDPDKIGDLRRTVALLGYELGGGDAPQPRHFAKLLRDVQDKPEAPVLTILVLRSLARAVYKPECAGHFGLALDAYAHFTSPIRRYPDLLVHRAIHHVLAGGKPHGYVHDPLAMKSMGQRCSASERRADEASWDVQAWLKCRYMEDKVGERFGGRITGVADFGFFVQIDDALVEGLIHVSQLAADYYEFRPESQALVGRSSGRRFRLGDRVRVLCAGVRTSERKIDFALEEHAGESQPEVVRPAGGRKNAGRDGGRGERKKGGSGERKKRSSGDRKNGGRDRSRADAGPEARGARRRRKPRAD